jgi:hypothetical protein
LNISGSRKWRETGGGKGTKRDQGEIIHLVHPPRTDERGGKREKEEIYTYCIHLEQTREGTREIKERLYTYCIHLDQTREGAGEKKKRYTPIASTSNRRERRGAMTLQDSEPPPIVPSYHVDIESQVVT